MTARLAHLNALRAFEATARLGSYVRAANELAVTPAAVGQQVRMLEEHFGSALFERKGRKLVLTEAARAVLPNIKDAFDRLAQAADHLRETRHADLVTITLPRSFTAKWLIPRIEAFSMAHPEVDLRLDTTDRLVDLLRENVTLGIRYGSGRYPGLDATLLMADEVFPVCSPSFDPHAQAARAGRSCSLQADSRYDHGISHKLPDLDNLAQSCRRSKGGCATRPAS